MNPLGWREEHRGREENPTENPSDKPLWMIGVNKFTDRANQMRVMALIQANPSLLFD